MSKETDRFNHGGQQAAALKNGAGHVWFRESKCPEGHWKRLFNNKGKVLPRIKSRSRLSYESRSSMNNVIVKVKGNIKIVFPYFCKCRSLNVDLRLEMGWLFTPPRNACLCYSKVSQALSRKNAYHKWCLWLSLCKLRCS